MYFELLFWLKRWRIIIFEDLWLDKIVSFNDGVILNQTNGNIHYTIWMKNI